MKLSIIIPTLNSSSVIRRAIDSIICQTFTDWEVLVMDGVSCDDTVLIAQSYQDSRIKVYSEPDKGIYDAMNKGIGKAQGEWLYFLGSDDWLLNNGVLYDVFNIHNINEYDIVYGNCKGGIYDERVNGEWSLSALLFNRIHQAIFYKNGVIQSLGGYSPRYKIAADFDMNLKWRLNKNIKSLYFPINIAYFSKGGISYTGTDSVFFEEFAINILKYGKYTLGINEKKYYIRLAIKNGNIVGAKKYLMLLNVYVLRLYGFVNKMLKIY